MYNFNVYIDEKGEFVLKKIISFILILILTLSIGVVFADDNAEIKIVDFPVSINGEVIDNMSNDYPLISYKNITYFPMTYDFSKALGLQTNWNAKDGLTINSTGVKEKLKQSLHSDNASLKSDIAKMPKFKITIKEKKLDNTKEEYPILVYRDITYFPLTWKFAVETFGWNYEWNNKDGLKISLKVSNEVKNNIKNEEETVTEVIENKEKITPISKFTDEDIKFLGINIDKNATDKEKADAILKWENDNIIFADSTKKYKDVADAMRFNYYFGDIYTTKDMIEKMKDGNKWYGICYNYATLFKSIGEYYGLEVKVENTVLKPSETVDFSDANNTLIPPGMSTEEYSRLNVFLDKKGLEYPYEAVRLIATETPAHYRAVVMIDNKWVVYDNVSTTTNSDSILSKYEFEDTDWIKGMQIDKLNSYIERLNNGESLKGEGYSSTFEEFQIARNLVLKTGEAEGYVGMTDDLGQTGRALSNDDFMQGKGLIPYFKTYDKVQKFLNLPSETNENKELMELLLSEYEKRSNKPFYMVAYEMIYGDDEEMADEKFAIMYESYVGERLNLKVFKEIMKIEDNY